jgi:hypothetical protein
VRGMLHPGVERSALSSRFLTECARQVNLHSPTVTTRVFKPRSGNTVTLCLGNKSSLRILALFTAASCNGL